MDIGEMMKMEFHFVRWYYDTLVRLNKEQEKKMKEQQEGGGSAPAAEYLGMMPNSSSVKSMMSNLSSGFKMPSLSK